jgi:hypothetical protein
MLLPVAVAAPYPDAQESEKGPRRALLAYFEQVQDGREVHSTGLNRRSGDKLSPSSQKYFTGGGRIKKTFWERSYVFTARLTDTAPTGGVPRQGVALTDIHLLIANKLPSFTMLRGLAERPSHSSLCFGQKRCAHT